MAETTMSTPPSQVISQKVHLGPKVYILDVKKYSPEIPLQFKLPDGEILKDLFIDIDGYVTPTFAGFTPAPNPFGVMDAIMGRIEVTTDGNKVRKAFRRPETLRRYTRLCHGVEPSMKYKVNATTLGDAPSIGNYAFGTTGQSIAFQESAAVFFQNKLSTDWSRTLLDLRGMTSSYLTIYPRPNGLLNLNKATVGGGSLSIVGDINVRVTIATWPAMAGRTFETWLQTVKEEKIAGQADNQKIQLPVGLSYQGIYCVVEKPDGTRVNHDDAKNIIFTLYKNETDLIYRVSLQNLMSQNENRLEMELVGDGAAYMDLLSNNVFETALDTRDAESIRSLHMSVSTPIACNVYLETDCIANI